MEMGDFVRSKDSEKERGSKHRTEVYLDALSVKKTCGHTDSLMNSMGDPRLEMEENTSVQT